MEKCVLVWARARHLGQVLLTPSHPLLNCGNIFFQPLSGAFFNFLYPLPMIHPASPLPSFSFPLLYKILCVCACVPVCTHSYVHWLLVSHISSACLSRASSSLSVSVEIVAVHWFSNIRWFKSLCFLLWELAHTERDLAWPTMQMKHHSWMLKMMVPCRNHCRSVSMLENMQGFFSFSNIPA